MNFEQARYNMIEQQLRPWKVLDPDVLDVLHVVKREEFVPAAHRRLAFADTENVLEVGTGSGYMAALLGAHADHVWSVEIDAQQADTARANLQRAGVSNVVVEVGNGLAGLAAHAPYDAVMVSGSVHKVPQVLLDQLKPGGRLFAIEGESPAKEAVLYTRVGDEFRRVAVFEIEVAALREAEPAQKFVF
jgi:protein-L-isoaspartate(D-aspartate) O-methyltransferase